VSKFTERKNDMAESKEGICVLCNKRTICAPISVPSDKLGKSDRLLFCRDCYGEVFYDNDFDCFDLHKSKERNMLDAMF
jgi:hypothetical protein